MEDSDISEEIRQKLFQAYVSRLNLCYLRTYAAGKRKYLNPAEFKRLDLLYKTYQNKNKFQKVIDKKLKAISVSFLTI